jgi:hypothetical protein
MVREHVSLPAALVAVNVTVYTPAANVWLGFCCDDVLESPNVHSQEATTLPFSA